MFPIGLAVYFRWMGTDNQLACSIHLDGRNVQINPEYFGVYKILNEAGECVGVFERDAVSCILPLKAAPNADNQTR